MLGFHRAANLFKRVITNRLTLFAALILLLIISVYQAVSSNNYVLYYDHNITAAKQTVWNPPKILAFDQIMANRTLDDPSSYSSGVSTTSKSGSAEIDSLLNLVHPNIRSYVQKKIDVTSEEINRVTDIINLINNSLSVSVDRSIPSGNRGTAYYKKLAAISNQSEKTLLNIMPYKLTLSPKNICQTDRIFILVYVHSAPEHYQRRLAIRETWGARNTFQPDFEIRIVFAVGVREEKPLLQDALEMESSQYGDILQENYYDSYKNLSLKGLSALQFLSLNCHHVPFILKTDDDTFVNMYGVVEHLHYEIRQQQIKSGETPGWCPGRTLKLKPEIQCLVWNGMPVLRETGNKWYVSEHEYEEKSFTTYCSGLAYIMTSEFVESFL